MLKTILRRLAEAGDFQIGGLVGRFTETSRGIAGIVATGRHAIPPALSEPMRADPSGNSLDFATLKDPPPRTPR